MLGEPRPSPGRPQSPSRRRLVGKQPIEVLDGQLADGELARVAEVDRAGVARATIFGSWQGHEAAEAFDQVAAEKACAAGDEDAQAAVEVAHAVLSGLQPIRWAGRRLIEAVAVVGELIRDDPLTDLEVLCGGLECRLREVVVQKLDQ